MSVKSGATRRVLKFTNFVVKLPSVRSYRLFLNGLLANLQEREFSKIGRNDLAKVFFCDVLGLFLVMERAEDVNYLGFTWEEVKDFVKRKYADDEMGEFMLSDNKAENWGYVKGILKKIDYGS